MKKLFFFAAAMFAAVSFSACTDDDKDKDLPITAANLAGTWQITLSEGWEIYDGTRDEWHIPYPDTSDGNYYWTFSFNNQDSGNCIKETFADYHDPNKVYAEDYTYSLSGKTLKLGPQNEIPLNYEIKKLTQSQLILYRSGEKYEETEIYTRIE